jgi:thymidine kinase
MPTPGPTQTGHARLEVILGCMFSGKSTELVRRLREAAGSGLAVVALKPVLDTRYAAAALATHTGDHFPARAISSAADLAPAAAGFDVIGLDEAHFFGSALAEPCVGLVRAGRRVIIAGVPLDHFGRPFDPFPALACHADEVVKLSAPCGVCGHPAVHSQRLASVPAAGRIVVGGAESYQPRCRACFVPSVPEDCVGGA